MPVKGYTLAAMQKIVPNVKETLMRADGEGAVIDVLGEIRTIESGLAELRRGSGVEFDSGQRGKHWKIVVPSPNKRSYNTPRLVTKFAHAAKLPLWDAFILLLRKDVIRLEWQFKKLVAAAYEYGVTLTTAQQEITEGDDADIGVFKVKGYPKYERID